MFGDFNAHVRAASSAVGQWLGEEVNANGADLISLCESAGVCLPQTCQATTKDIQGASWTWQSTNEELRTRVDYVGTWALVRDWVVPEDTGVLQNAGLERAGAVIDHRPVALRLRRLPPPLGGVLRPRRVGGMT